MLGSAFDAVKGQRPWEALTLTCLVILGKALEFCGSQNQLFAEVLCLRPAFPWFKRRDACY